MTLAKSINIVPSLSPRLALTIRSISQGNSITSFSEDPLPCVLTSTCYQMQEAMEYWGYPVSSIGKVSGLITVCKGSLLAARLCKYSYHRKDLKPCLLRHCSRHP